MKNNLAHRSDEAVRPVELGPLTENQRKVITDKYLKGAPSVEAWLKAVAHNIALSELLYHPSANLWGLFDGVRVFKKETRIPGQNFSTRSWLLHEGLYSSVEREANFKRFLDNLEKLVVSNPEAKARLEEWENRFYNLMATWEFLPNSPTLMNAGREIQQLSACYVLPIDDSMEGITHALQAQALIHKSGGGTGFSFERLRPSGDPVKSTSGVASGAVSFMQVFDKMTDVVKQGGNRRGANMAVLPYWHPEIMDFVKLKTRPGLMENFNISVAVDQRFMDAVEHDGQIELLHPKTKEAAGQMSARVLFDTIVESAWKTGDPGVIFMDRINQSGSNATPSLGKIEATNPCGEQPLLPNEPCNLGSINVALFVKESGEPGFDWDRLQDTVYDSIRFLDNVIDVNNYPLPEIESMAKGNRRIGLGIMGWAEALVKLRIPYDSERATKLARELMEKINIWSLEASEHLSEERGAFSNWKMSIYDPEGPFFRGMTARPRNCARTTIAPTGTIGLAAGLQGAGIEPFYGIAYTRFNAQALEDMKNGRAPEPKDVYYEINPLFKEIAARHKYFGLTERELWEKIERNRKSVRGIAEIPEDIQELFATSHDVSVEAHVKMQAAFQAFTDNAVSKTINMSNNASIQNVREAYQLAHKHGCKGITVYRDGSKQQQVLNFTPPEKRVKKARDFSMGVSSEYYEMKSGHGPVHVHIDYDESGPFRVFASLPPVGTELSGLTAIVGILISKYLEEGGNPNHLIKHLQSIKGDRPLGFGENRVNSISHAIALALKNHLTKHNWLENLREDEPALGQSPLHVLEDAGQMSSFELWKLAQASDQCPKCYGSNIMFTAGCSGPLCQDCGYSECL